MGDVAAFFGATIWERNILCLVVQKKDEKWELIEFIRYNGLLVCLSSAIAVVIWLPTTFDDPYKIVFYLFQFFSFFGTIRIVSPINNGIVAFDAKYEMIFRP